jgi:hypothetical protein
MTERTNRWCLAGFLVVILLTAALGAEEHELILDDDWNLWFRIGPTLGVPLGDAADINGKLTFAYGGLVGGSLGKLPGNWSFEFLKTESTMTMFDLSPTRAAMYTASDVQFLFSYQLPLTGRSGLAPYVELIAGAILYTANIEAQVLSQNQWVPIGVANSQRFTYVMGGGAGASLLIGTVSGSSDSRPIGLALQIAARWLTSGPVNMIELVSGNYPTLKLRHFQNFSLGFGLVFLI